MRPCTFPGGCKVLVRQGERCARHPLTAAEASRRKRRPAAQTLYQSAEWKRYSKSYLVIHRWCVCPKHKGATSAKGGARSEVVDHITKHHGNLTLFWEPSNHQALAKACHDSWKRRVENEEARASQDGGSVYSGGKARAGANPESFKGYPAREVGSSRVDLQACKLEYSIVSPK